MYASSGSIPAVLNNKDFGPGLERGIVPIATGRLGIGGRTTNG